ncbi:MAG: cobalamin-binding protein [Pseudomonadota bacterium]
MFYKLWPIKIIPFFMLYFLLPQLLQAQIKVLDDNQQSVVLTHKAQRIISLSPSITEMLFAAGAGKQVIGVVSYSNFPPQAKKITSVGSYNSLDIEKIISLNPDLIIAWKSGNPIKQVNKLKALGYPVFISEALNFEDISNNIKNFGILSGNEPVSQLQSQQFITAINDLQKKYKDKQQISVFVQIWNKPVMTVGAKHIISRVIQLCGGINIFNNSKLTITPDVESVIQAKPQLILSTGMANLAKQWLKRWENWTMIPAVRNNHLYSTNPDLLVRHSPRLVQGTKNVCLLIDKVRRSEHGN